MTMARVYDYYGSPEQDLVRLRDQVAEAASLTFTYRESSYTGDYYATEISRCQHVKVLRNLDALDGGLRWARWAEYKLIIEAGFTLEDEAAPPAFLDDLRRSLSTIPGLVHLDRKRPVPPRRPAAGSERRTAG